MKIELKQILIDRPFALNDESKLSSILQDYYGKDKYKANLLMFGYKNGLVSALLAGADKAQTYNKYKYELEQNYRCSSTDAEHIVKTWIDCIDDEIIASYERYQKDLSNHTPEKETYEIIEENILEESQRKGSIITVVNEKISPASEIIIDTDYFPCGCGNADFGFKIQGIKKQPKCTSHFAPYYAIVFSLLQLRLNFQKSRAIEFYEKEIAHKALDLSRVYRLQMIILSLIRHNYLDSNCGLPISYDGDMAEIDAALYNINDMAKKIYLLATDDELPNIHINTNKKISVSLDNNADIYIENTDKRISFERNVWFENNIIFNIDLENESHIRVLKELLFDNFGSEYYRFREGQLETIANILNDNTHKVCVMPTGSGKSLIFYFVSILRSCPTFVVSPTEILIDDQMRNLLENHKIDDVFKLNDNHNLEKYVPRNKLIYLTPQTFLNRDLINQLIRLNYKQLIGNVVLDEVHCISNWSHDFRPEYLMLSHNLNSFVDKTGYLCFTATANYTVMRDIQSQLKIKTNQILSPVGITNEDIHFTFVECENNDSITDFAAKDYEKDITNNRILSFVKNENLSTTFYSKLTELSQDVTDRYIHGEDTSYIEFAAEKVKGLIADSEMGIGVNLRSINETFHIGMPISKSEFVQEIGRAGRNHAKGISKVYFLSKQYLKDMPYLLQRTIPIKELLVKLNDLKSTNDIIDTYKLLFCGTEDENKFKELVQNLYSDIANLKEPCRIRVEIDQIHTVNLMMKCLYVIYRLGLIDGWYLVDLSKDNYADFYIDPGKSTTDIKRSKEVTINYLRSMGDFNRAIREIKNVDSIPTLIDAYLNWYYEQFLYHHREQMLDMYEFLNHYKDKEDTVIFQAISNYFSLSLLSIEKDAAAINKMSMKDIGIYALSDVQESVADSIGWSIENEYSYRQDYFLFCYNIKSYNDVNISRLTRVLSGGGDADKVDILSNISEIYELSDDISKMQIISELCKYFPLGEVINNLYSSIDFDSVYYLILVLCFNKKWGCNK